MDSENSSTDGTNEDAYECDKCGRTFQKYTVLRQHTCVKRQTRLYKGPPAQRVAKIVMQQWPYRCYVCGHSFTNSREMMVHMKQRHWLKNGRQPCVCRTCLKAGWIRVPLGELQRRVQLAEERPDQASDERSSSPMEDSDVTSSPTKESGEVPPLEEPSAVKRRQCPVCGRVLASEANMRVHLRTHTGERPFPCKTCDNAYASRSGLRRHEVEKHAAPKCAWHPARRTAATTVYGRNVGPLASVPVREEPMVVVVPEGDKTADGGHDRVATMAVVPDTSSRTVPVKWLELIERTREYVETTGGTNAFFEHVCRDQLPPPSPDNLEPTLPCVLNPTRDGMRALRQQVEVTDPVTGAKHYQCNVCRKYLKRFITWRRHVKQHGYVTPGLPRKVYACADCPASARTRDTLREHVKMAHPRKKPKNTAVCPLCQSVLYDKHSLVRHTRLVHGFADGS